MRSQVLAVTLLATLVAAQPLSAYSSTGGSTTVSETRSSQETSGASVILWDEVGSVGAVNDSEGNPPAGGRYFPDLLTSHGGTYAIWVDNRVDDPYGYRNPEVMLRRSTSDGSTWGALRNLSADPDIGDDGNPSLAANDISELAVFTTKTQTGAPAWSGPNKLSVVRDLGGQAQRQRVDSDWITVDAAGSGSAYFLTGMSVTGWVPQFRRSLDDGRTWSNPVTLGASMCYQADADAYPSVAASGSSVVVTYVSYCGGYWDVYRVTSNDGGSTWSPPMGVTETPQRESAAETYTVDGVMVSAWQTVRSETLRTVEVSRSADGGTTWTSPTTVHSYERGSSDWSFDHVPWNTPAISGDASQLVLYPPLSGDILTSTDSGLTWAVSGTAPESSTKVSLVHQATKDLFAWAHEDLDAWVGTQVRQPTAPVDVSATASGDAVVVSWTKGDEDEPESYTVHDQDGNTVATVSGDVTRATIRDLTYGDTYSFTVVANNAAGESPPSQPSNQITAPAQAPDAPAKPTCTHADQAVTVTWAAPPANGSPVTGYTVTSSPGGFSKTVASDQTTATVTGLSNGTTYSFTVKATNAVGASTPSPPCEPATPAGKPSQVSKPTVSVRKRTATVRWAVASGNGSPVTKYIVTNGKGQSKTVSAGSRKVVFKRLSPGRYAFRVTAHNTEGAGARSPAARVRIRKP